MNQHYFDVPFAFAGDVTAIPDPLQVGGTVSMTEGWNNNYQRNLATDPAALPIDRSTTNWLLLQISTAIQALQQASVPEFILASQNGGVPYSYGKGTSVLWSATGTAPFVKHVSLTAGNTNTPSASDPQGLTTGWQIVVDPISTAAQASAGTDDASIMTPLKVAQQTALRALLAGSSSQVFNVAPATASQHAAQLGQLQSRAGSAGGLSFRNIIHNGAFNINQRQYASGTATTSANQLTLDRWKVQTLGQSLTFAASGAGNAITAPTGGLAQVIEGANVAGGTYCASWVGAGTITVNGTAVANGSNFTLPANTNATVILFGAISDLQIESGTVPTAFEFRPVPVELAICQRYAYVLASGTANLSVGNGQFYTTTSLQGIQVPLPVSLRATPSISNIGTGAIYVFTSGTVVAAGVPTNINLSGALLTFSCTSASAFTVGAIGAYLLFPNAILVISADI